MLESGGIRWHRPVKCGLLYLGEAATVLSHDVRVGTLQFLDDLETLVELGEDVHHGAGEQGVLRSLLELRASR